jgi:TnpA family transposase
MGLLAWTLRVGDPTPSDPAATALAPERANLIPQGRSLTKPGTPCSRIDMDLITANWPDMLRLAGSLTAGTVRASEILRVTQGGGTPTLLGRALAEYGRIAKTGHLLDFIDVDEGHRR